MIDQDEAEIGQMDACHSTFLPAHSYASIAYSPHTGHYRAVEALTLVADGSLTIRFRQAVHAGVRLKARLTYDLETKLRNKVLLLRVSN